MRNPIILLGLIVTIILFSKQASSQQSDDKHHHHYKNEIGISNSPVYMLNEKEFAYGLHVHYVHMVGESKFGIGVGYERLFDEHKHNTLGLVGSYIPSHGWTINISPGLTFEEHDSIDLKFAMHLETSYHFEFDRIHIGPVLELAYDPEDYHISLGLHIGFGF